MISDAVQREFWPQITLCKLQRDVPDEINTFLDNDDQEAWLILRQTKAAEQVTSSCQQQEDLRSGLRKF